MRLVYAAALTFFTFAGGVDRTAQAAQIFAITGGNGLLSFDSTTPGTTTPVVPITGLQPAETLVGIDFRPATTQLYGVGSSSTIYVINTATGAATAAGPSFSPALSGSSFGVDFNPTVDRLRIVSNTGQNLRVNPIAGAIAATDTPLNFAAADVNAGRTPNVVASAYTNNFAGAATTTLYGIDSNLGILVTQNPPNNGTLNTVGPLGLIPNGIAGFDISAVDGTAFASFSVGNGAASLYTVNLATGAAMNVGTIGRALTITDISVVTTPEPGALFLSGFGLVGLMAWRWKQKVSARV
ncbi:MAG: DUF4394 domain-containing protein [Acidobacteriota bacterium]|nr:DUF4394 domain-containing protein [Acidobacteriota bacterium]